MPLQRTTPRPTKQSQDTSEHEEELNIEPTVSIVESQDIAGPSGIVVQPKKRYRPSKKDIQDYPFTPEDKEVIMEFIKPHPTLYDKRDKQWSNPRRKEELWCELAASFIDCSFQQVRKFFEARRTDFGKIEKREYKSGSAARSRTPREEEVMTRWAFLGGHIAHEPTVASDRFSPMSSQRTDADDSSTDMSGLSAASIQRRRRLKQKRATNLPEDRRLSADMSVDSTEGLQTQLTQIMTSINTLMPQAQDNTHRDIAVFVQYLT
ncbi:uncharacterized protein LOC135198826 [Macrobrachium nipponense]|uniref:uncharacterized protein LOC135198826 n=1 Tax=Macrobrachium nipponense TaxID=159736 RepID=UPI0030C8422E